MRTHGLMGLEAQRLEGGESPPLGLLQLEMAVNVTDSQLIKNLSACKLRGLKKLGLTEAHNKVLAIVGSGPSLRNTYGLIPPDCDVMALNGAYKFLRGKGRNPKYFAMLDSRAVNTNFLDVASTETLHLLASQCHDEAFSRLRDFPLGMFHLGTPTTKKVFPGEDLYVGGGGTVGLTALSLAYVGGYRRVILFGFDSSFSGELRHAEFQPQNADEEVIDVWVGDRKYLTTRAMAAQTMDFFPFYDAIRQICPEFTIDLIGNGLFYDYIVTNNNAPSRERELSKYADAYKQPDYGMTLERAQGIAALLSQVAVDSTSYLDVSTGRGESLDLARQYGYKVVQGTETVDALCNEHVIKAVLPDIPFPDKSFDVVSLIEVIEHLLPMDIEPALYELTRLAKKHILISAAVAACWIGGVNLHPSAMPVEEWDALFKRVWGDRVYRVGNLGSSPCWRVDL